MPYRWTDNSRSNSSLNAARDRGQKRTDSKRRYKFFFSVAHNCRCCQPWTLQNVSSPNKSDRHQVLSLNRTALPTSFEEEAQQEQGATGCKAPSSITDMVGQNHCLDTFMHTESYSFFEPDDNQNCMSPTPRKLGYFILSQGYACPKKHEIPCQLRCGCHEESRMLMPARSGRM